MKRSVFLKSTGICLALPYLESLDANPRSKETIRRFVGVAGPLGVYGPAFFPKGEGKDYKLSESTQSFAPLKKDITFFSNLDHGLTGGHQGVKALFSGVKLEDAASNPLLYPEKNISLDQKFADQVGYKTRFHSLAVHPAEKNRLGLMNTVTWTKNGIAVPNIEDVNELFNKLFKQDDEKTKQYKHRNSSVKTSILDAVLGQAKTLNAKLGKEDQYKIDQYFTSVRGLEKKIQTQKSWIHKDKPKVKEMRLEASMQSELFPLFFDLLHLALQTDSTRSAVFHLPMTFDTTNVGVANRGYHGCSHHGKNPGAVDDLKKVDRFFMDQVARFVTKLKETQLLDDTVVAFGSGMSNGSSHSNDNLPILVAGGGFQHGEHKDYSSQPNKKVPLCNLYLTILQSLGVEIDKFGNSTGTINAFQMA